MAGCGRPDLTRTPQMGVLEIFDAPGRSQAISPEEKGWPHTRGLIRDTAAITVDRGNRIVFCDTASYADRGRGRRRRPPAGRRNLDRARQHQWRDRPALRASAYSTARLDELLAQLGYLPLTWTPSAGQTVPADNDAAGQLAAADNAPQGHFTWKSGYPSELRRFWRDGTTDGLILQGAVMAFEQQHGLKIYGIAGPKVWDALFAAVAAHDANKNGYTYAIASEGDPETLTIWHNGHQVLQTDADTGIPASPTTIGTSPVYLKHYYQDMKGTNPNGTRYSSPVYYISYFRGSLAVHWYPRASYGFPQSLGCVELPWSVAKTAWQYLSYGTLVTIRPGSLTPSTSPVDPTT